MRPALVPVTRNGLITNQSAHCFPEVRGAQFCDTKTSNIFDVVSIDPEKSVLAVSTPGFLTATYLSNSFLRLGRNVCNNLGAFNFFCVLFTLIATAATLRWERSPVGGLVAVDTACPWRCASWITKLELQPSVMEENHWRLPSTSFVSSATSESSDSSYPKAKRDDATYGWTFRKWSSITKMNESLTDDINCMYVSFL